MKIDKDHLYYGAAVIQVAEHRSFKAINAFEENGKHVRCAYVVNKDIGLYLRYLSTKNRTANIEGNKVNEYLFQFRPDHLKTVEKLRKAHPRTYIGLVCVEDEQICCISAEQLTDLIHRRKRDAGHDEDQYIVIVAIGKRIQFRVYVTPAGRKNAILGQPVLIPQSAFPECIF